MPITLRPKRSSTAAKVPTTTDLASGELGVNMADRKVYINNGTSIVQVGAGLLTALGDVSISAPSAGQVISWNGAAWVASSAGAGTVTSVAISGGTTGLTTSGGPITTSGTITLAGTLALANGGTGATDAAGARTNLGLAIGTNVQAWDGDLDAIAALAGTSGLLRKTAADTWSLDTNSYLTGNQSISLSGDASGSGTTSISVTLANSGVTAGTYTKVTVDAKGRVTAGAALASADLPTYTGTLTSSQVTTALGYTPYNSTNPNGYTSNTGTVTSVALSLPAIFSVSGSPVTTSGTLTAALASQTANTVWAAPNGSAGAPTFRALVAADIPALTLENLPDAWVKRSVRVATTANITLSGTQTIDGVAVVAGDRVLVKDQTAAAENGIYVVAAGAWSRAADANTASELASANVGVDSGTSNGGICFDTDFKSTDTLGTTAMSWFRLVDTGLASSTNPLVNGTVAVGTSINYARADHVHPTDTSRAATNQTFFLGTTSIAINRASASIALTGITSIDGSAATLTTGRTIAMTGDVSYTSGSFNGSANVTGTATLANSGVTEGTYTKVTVDAKGRVTAGASLASADLPTYTGTLTSSQITTALGFTPYNATNPSGYITTDGTARTIVKNNGTTAGTRRAINFIPGTGISLSITDDSAGEEVDVTITSTASGGVTSFNTRTGAVTLSSSDVTTALGATPVYTSTNQTIAGDKTFSGLTNFTNGRAQVQSAGVAMWEMHIPGAHARAWYLDTSGITRLATTNGVGSASTVQVSVDGSSNMTVAGNVTANSDERLKTNWRDLPADFVDQLAGVRHGIYDRIDVVGLTQVGVSAQSMQRVLAQSVLSGDNGILSVNYGNAALVSAIALAQRVLQLEARIEQLESNAA